VGPSREWAPPISERKGEKEKSMTGGLELGKEKKEKENRFNSNLNMIF
jgi:hypothetical protein